VIAILCLSALAGSDRLPLTISADPIPQSQQATREWAAKDIVEIRRITSLALSSDKRAVAFIVKQLFVDTNDVRYGLYVHDNGPAHKIAESSYIADLTSHPKTGLWTVRADLGSGVQLYDIDSQAHSQPLVVNPQLSPMGGNLGVIRSAIEAAHPTGVFAYGWAPDGESLWYTKARVRTAEQLERRYEQGTVYDPDSTFAISIFRASNPMLGTELHWASPKGAQDRLLKFAPLNEIAEVMPFLPEQTHWSADGTQIRFQLSVASSEGQIDYSRWTVEVATGNARRLPQGSASSWQLIGGLPLPDDDGYLAVKAIDDHNHLVKYAADGSVAQDFGTVDFVGLVHGDGPGWKSAGRGYLYVRYPNHEGLAAFPLRPRTDPLLKISDHLSECELSVDLTIAVCVRESITLAPEVVQVTLCNGHVQPIARPNAQYAAIKPLRSEYREWRNRFGSKGVGYLTYPRNYELGQRYPVLVVTHAEDAQNRFAEQGFQWDHPVQLFAATGYLVLSLNDPLVDSRTQEASEIELTASSRGAVEEMQFHKNVNPLASMEAAVQWAIDSGIGDAEHVGILGYSRGCEVVEYALSHSKMFKVGISGDAGGWNAGGYWADGTTIYRSLYKGMYGGSPYDPAAQSNYAKYNPAFRAADFAGPFLQQFAMTSGTLGLELNALLRDAHIPNDLILYPDETHLFWQPKHRMAAMEMDLHWINYWLFDKRETAPEMEEQYRRWDNMRQQWRAMPTS
jgi:dipeptidyl aminopeptidase/acylaminoacyl peptidase